MELLSSEAALLCSLFVGLSMAAVSGEFRAARKGFDLPPDALLGKKNLALWEADFLTSPPAAPEAMAPSPNAGFPLILAAGRTKRPDILHSFKLYRGGWDITNRHYWTSAGFTGAAGFILAFVWFIFFGICLVANRCCKWKIRMKHKQSSYGHQIYLMFLVAFTCTALIGSIVLSIGQDKFHGEVLHTLAFVVNQSDCTVQILQNVTEFLSLAKTVNVDQFILPPDVPHKIDHLIADLNHAASTLSAKTMENSGRIRKMFGNVRCMLIAVSAVMFVIASLGFVLSLFQTWEAIYILAFSGCLLVALTLVLFGVFLILNNVVLDTCMAMTEWAENPHTETALSSILACVDQRTSRSTLQQSKQVVFQLTGVVNAAINAVANADGPRLNSSSFYNQSGPLMPALCSPFDSQLDDQMCPPSQVSLDNASQVWERYICEVSLAGECTTIGRVTPSLYSQLAVAVNVSYALYRYTPFLVSLQDCNFVRETFEAISSFHCPRLERPLRMVEAGLGLVSAGTILCLLLWVLHADQSRREEASVKPGQS